MPEADAAVPTPPRAGGPADERAADVRAADVRAAQSSANPSPETSLATWIAGLRSRDLPATVAERVRLLLLDAIASAIAGRTTVDAAAMLEVATTFAGEGEASVIGGGTRSLAGACLANGYQITAATVCDVHRPTLCHVTPEVVPPVLAVAETQDRGGDVIAALAAGLETTVRIGLAAGYPAMRARGWHSPGVVGPIGGAAAVASVLGLDPRSTRDAMALGASQAAGTFAGLGTAQVKLHQARGGVSGLLAGIAAAGGFDGSPRFLTAPDGGLFASYAEGGDPGRLTEGLGESWDLLGISLRRWPAASSLQAVVQASLGLAGGSTGGGPRGGGGNSGNGPEPGAVRSIRVGLPEGSYHLNGKAGWATQLSAFQSARYVAAVILHDRRCWLAQFDPGRLTDPVVAATAGRHVTVEVDPSVAGSGASVTWETRAGETLTERVDVPLGDPAAPLDWDDVLAKLGDAAAGGPLEGRTAAIAEAVSALDRGTSIRALTRLLRAD
jgi:2-methylcitrate dehydratase PrpD